MTLVVDACVAAKWFFDEPQREAALSMLDAGHELHTTELLLIELANIAWRKVVQGEIPETEAALILKTAPRFFHATHSSSPYAKRALEIGISLNHPVYDCFYLACAEVTDATVVTADRRFYRAAADGGFARRIVLLGGRRERRAPA